MVFNSTFDPKKDGSDRFFVDYLKVNNITIKDRIPIPIIEELFDDVSDKELFSCLDLTAGLWQISLAEEAYEKTAFVVNNNQCLSD